MKKIIVFIIVLIFGGLSFLKAQCPTTVSLMQSPQNPVCKNTTVTFTANPSAGGISDYIWVVNGDTVVNNDSVYSTAINFAIVEVYAVSDTCTFDTMYANAQIVNVELQAEYNVIIEECNQPVADVQILNISGGQEPYSYYLYTTNGSLGEKNLYPDLPVSSYPLVIEDNNGCIDTFFISMDAVMCPPPDPIEAFTPNEDGYNDYWHIRNIEFYEDNEVFIYDRWGQRVYHKKGYSNQEGWEAKYIGSNMPVSTYYYIIKIKYQKQDEQVFKGPISIFR